MSIAPQLNGTRPGLELNRNSPSDEKISTGDLRTIYPPLELEEHPIDNIVPLNAIVVGGGIAGILAGILLPEKVPGLKLIILEATGDIGGVWNTNVYPGVRCDIPADVYQATFTPNTNWSSSYASGAEIKSYWKGVVEKYDIERFIQFNSLVTRATWSPDRAKWTVEILQSGISHVEETDFLITATGHFSQPKLPDIPGIGDYTGHLRHSSNWDPKFDARDKTVAVIGNGASGLQVVPPLQKVASKLYHFARSPTWVAGSFAGEVLGQDPTVAREVGVPQSPEAYNAYRKDLTNRISGRFAGIFKNEEKNNAARVQFETLMADRLGERSDLLSAIRPDFSPNCRRLTPGPGYLEALTQDNVQYVPERILRFSKTGIETVDGKHRDVDAVICSTGADISFSTAFPIIANGKNLQSSWRPGGDPGFPDSYLGVASPGFPNLLILLGPNSTGPSGTLTHSLENQVTWVAKVLRKVSQQGIRTIAPTRAATDDFRAYCESFFPRTVMSENCSSWYNGGIIGGRIHGLWPGSGTHVNIVRREVRWEDFEFTYRSSSGNRFAYFGNGWSKRDIEAAENPDVQVDYTPHLLPEAVEGNIDLKLYHEAWNEFQR